MQHKSTEELTRSALRSRICRICSQRPHGSEQLEPFTPRACEPRCTIFLSLPQVIAAWHEKPDMEADELIQHYICPACQMSTSAGEFCPEHLARTCPLSVYSSDVIDVLEHMRRLTRAAS